MSTRSTLLTAFLLLLTLLATTLTLSTRLRWDRHPSPGRPSAISSQAENRADGKKVSLEIHIMSQCPDAKDCLEMLIAPAMATIEDIVDFRMSFIGRPTGEGISCKHGPSECLGNTVHLCAAHLYPTSTSLPFSVCLTHNYALLPSQSFIESCAAQHGVDFAALNDCVSDISPEGGLGMLRKSVERSHRLGAEVSCTVRVDGAKWCVRDSGIWKDCNEGSQPENLVERVEAIHKSRVDGGQREEGEGLMQQARLKVEEWIRSERIVWRA